MTEQKQNNNSREFILGLFIIFFIFVLSLFFPLIAPVLGIALLLSGIFTYRKNTNADIHTVAIIAIVAGVVLLLIVILIALFLIRAN